MKAFYVFYRDEDKYCELTRKLIKIRETLIDEIEYTDDDMRDHPWELIFKYAAFLGIKDECSKENIELAEKAADGSGDGIVDMIVKNAKAELLRMKSMMNSDAESRLEYAKIIDYLYNTMVEKDVITLDYESNTEDKRNEINRKLTYMYC